MHLWLNVRSLMMDGLELDGSALIATGWAPSSTYSASLSRTCQIFTLYSLLVLRLWLRNPYYKAVFVVRRPSSILWTTCQDRRRGRATICDPRGHPLALGFIPKGYPSNLTSAWMKVHYPDAGMRWSSSATNRTAENKRKCRLDLHKYLHRLWFGFRFRLIMYILHRLHAPPSHPPPPALMHF